MGRVPGAARRSRPRREARHVVDPERPLDPGDFIDDGAEAAFAEAPVLLLLEALAQLGVLTLPEKVAAVVSRGGRPDLAGRFLAEVTAPTLLIVGGADIQVLELNRSAAEKMTAPHRIAVVPGATHLFEEPGTLDEVARLAGEFLARELGAVRGKRGGTDVDIRPLA